MKRTDLREGAEYMFADRKYAAERFTGKRVTLVDLGPFIQSYSGTPLELADGTVVPVPERMSRARTYRRSDKGQLVAVRGLGYDADSISFVRTATLICTWADAEAGNARVMAAEKAANRRRLAAAQERSALDNELTRRLAPYVAVGGYDGLAVNERADRVTLSTDVLLALLGAAEATK